MIVLLMEIKKYHLKCEIRIGNLREHDLISCFYSYCNIHKIEIRNYGNEKIVDLHILLFFSLKYSA